MHVFNFYKIANVWHMDDPDYLEAGGNPSLLEVIGGMNDLLELLAKGKSSVQLLADTEPFEGADVMELLAPSGGNSGGHYRLQNLNGKVLNHELWLNELLYIYFNELPARIYVKFI